jgi:hypothetical protein
MEEIVEVIMFNEALSIVQKISKMALLYFKQKMQEILSLFDEKIHVRICMIVLLVEVY